MDDIEIYTHFIKKFVLKNKRERVLLELTNPKKRNQFIDNLNHKSLNSIDGEKLILLPKNGSEYSQIKEKLNVDDTEVCLLISNYNHLDKRKLCFSEAFELCDGLEFATLMIFISQNKIYLQTEIELGNSNKYIGI